MKTWCAVGLVLILTAGASSAAIALSPSVGTPRLLEATREKYQFPGLACAVIKHGRLDALFATGVRKLGDPTPLTTNDIFHIGSCTKSMTATLAAMLIEQGGLKWNTTIGEVFPDLVKEMSEQYRQVTLEQLLTHRGGVPTKPPEAAWARAWKRHGTPTQQRYDFISAVLREQPEAAPGTKYIYSNQGYAIVGAMIERITSASYESLMIERLFKPLHMNSAGFGPPGSPGKVDEPWGHGAKGGVTIPLQEDNPPAIAPAGTVHCSLGDLAKYAISHLERERLDGLLKPETYRKLHTPADGGDYACGWISVKRDWAGGAALNHSGSNTMWYVVIWLAPAKDFGVIVATNTGVGDTSKGCDEVAAALIKQWRQSAD